MIRLLLSALAGTGTALVLADRLAPGAVRPRPVRPAPVDVRAVFVRGAAGAAIMWLAFGSAPLALVGLAAGPLAARLVHARARRRREVRLLEAWPRLLEEARVLCGPGGLSMPQALIVAGRSAPPDLRRAWASGERAWRLSTDLSRALAAVRQELDDPTTALVCSTLEMIEEAGGPSRHEQLGRLARDRARDATTRREAEARLAGARFARSFVLIAPAGMALAGQAVGTGRAAFTSPAGQLAVLAALAVTAACWAWSGRLLTLPVSPAPPA